MPIDQTALTDIARDMQESLDRFKALCRESAKPSPRYKLEAGCRVYSDDADCDGTVLQFDDDGGLGVQVLFGDGTKDWHRAESLTVTAPAEIEVDDVVWHKGQGFGVVDHVSNKRGLPFVKFRCGDAHYRREDLLIHTKADHGNQSMAALAKHDESDGE